MNGNELLLAFADINEFHVSEAADTAAARQIFRRYKTRRNRMIGTALCCVAVVLAAAGFGFRGLQKKLPTVLPPETSNASQFTESRFDIVPTTFINDADTTAVITDIPSASADDVTSSIKPSKIQTLPSASSSVPTASDSTPTPSSQSNPETTGVITPSEQTNTTVSPQTGQITTSPEPKSTTTAVPTTALPPTATAPTQVQPSFIVPDTSISPTVITPTDSEQSSEIIPSPSLIVTEPTSEQPSYTVPVAEPPTTEAIIIKQYVFSVQAQEYASYISGRVIDASDVGPKIGDATATAGWKYANGSMPIVETLRCEIYEIAGKDRTVAVCVKFIDKGEALTTDHFYALCNPAAGVASVSEFLIPTTLPNNEE